MKGKLTVSSYIGKLGEDLAVMFLEKHGYRLKERNYLRKYGEIDIICENKGKLDFFEVKAVSRGTLSSSVSSETLHRPEENIDFRKIQRLRRVIETYLTENKLHEKQWEFNVVTVEIIEGERRARIRLMPNIVL